MRWTDGCCSASKTTIAADHGPSSRPASWTTWTWLEFRPDIFATDGFRAGWCESRQSDRDGLYRAALDRLRSRGLVYACDCTRRTIAASGEPSAELRYPGTCRERGLPLQDGYGWRIRMDPGEETFDDARLGPRTQNPWEQCGDLLARDRDGNWTYQFAVTVDDWQQEIDLVIRGVDLLASTGRQIRLARLLGRARPPVYLHHGLIMKSPTQKLSKSDGDTGIADLRGHGHTREEIVRMATHNR